MNAPTIVDRDADARLSALLRQTFPETHEWEYRYVDHEWSRIRHVFQSQICEISGRRVLEFGCNIGASSIVMAHLGRRICIVACDISETFLTLARLNAARYGVSDAIQFVRLQEGAGLPFGDRTFDVITCNSVLEYVKPADLPYIQRELDRVLRPGGHVVVLGTSNRLWPIEAHSRRWLVNYVPARFDRFFGHRLERGVWPRQIRSGFGPYEDVLAELGTEQYMGARNAAQDSWGKRCTLKLAARFCAVFGLSPGFLTPYLFAILRKPPTQPAR